MCHSVACFVFHINHISIFLKNRHQYILIRCLATILQYLPSHPHPKNLSKALLLGRNPPCQESILPILTLTKYLWPFASYRFIHDFKRRQCLWSWLLLSYPDLTFICNDTTLILASDWLTAVKLVLTTVIKKTQEQRKSCHRIKIIS